MRTDEILPSLNDIISPPSESVLDAQTERFGHSGVLRGKFIRIGRLPLLAPDVTVERLPGMRSGNIEHVHIIQAAFRNPNLLLSQRVRHESDETLDAFEGEELGPPLLADSGLLDAGRFEFLSAARCLSIFDKSYKFGRADESGRLETVCLTQQSVGEGVGVEAAE